ncbi:MAG TPA: hypothetical protein VK250_05195 [Nitrososphaeraceae archaeon]|nr:hypothetical protein [Nitrososphaeraceae archaeon]
MIALRISIIFLVVTCISSPITIYPQSDNSTTEQIKSTAQQIKDLASRVASNASDDINTEEAKKILVQLGDAARSIALGGADVLSNISGEIRSGLNK